VEKYLHWALKKWLVAMVATWMDDSKENHAILTLIGPQGVYKTTFFRHILPPALQPYFWENAHNSFHMKDDHFSLTENCLVEIEEVDAFDGKNLSELKGLVTASQIKERRPYAKFRTRKYRLASLCASGNEQYILTDMSGNRRWLCFWVDAIDNPHEWQLNYEQFYAQLLSEYSNGFRYYFDKTEEARIEDFNKPFYQVSEEEELIVANLRKPYENETGNEMNATMIARYLNGGRLSASLSKNKIGKIMRYLNYDYRLKHNMMFYRVVLINGYDQQRNLDCEDLTDEKKDETFDCEPYLPF
jgi:predicted P-loop ATPase